MSNLPIQLKPSKQSSVSKPKDMVIIVDDLITGGRDKVLSAEQGKILKELVDRISIEGIDLDVIKPLIEKTVSNSTGELKSNISKIENVLNDHLKNHGSSSITEVSYFEPSTGDIPRVFFEGDITGMSKSVSKDLKIRYISKTSKFEGVVKMKWQGTSSISYPKKNFTINMYTDSSKSTKLKKDFRGWGSQSKFCLKANYIDHSHARNIVSARLWSDVVKSRNTEVPEELTNAPNSGAIDGFPIKLYMNGKYEGIYTWNIPKDGWMFNMDEGNAGHAVLCGEDYVSGCFNALANINGSDWSLEFPDTLNPNIKTSFNNAISFVMNNDGEDFRNGIANYFDLSSIIDYYIFTYVACGLDSLGKNQIYVTYDGIHWIASMYDMDSMWGLYWNGASFVSPEYRFQEDYETGKNSTVNTLYKKLGDNFREEIYNRYIELINGPLSITNIINRFEEFNDLISRDLFTEDCEIYTGIPSANTNNIKQIRTYAVNRMNYVDRMIRSYVEFIPVEGLTLSRNSINLVNGMTTSINISLIPSVATNKELTWEVIGDTGIVEITPSNDKCVIKALNIGSVVLKCTSKDTTNGIISKVCNVSVSESASISDAVYSIDEPEVFSDGKFIDTGFELYNTPDLNYTIFMDVTPSSTQPSGGENTILHCMKEESPYPGITFDIQRASYRISVGQSNNESITLSAYGLTSTCNVNFRIILRKNNNNLDMWLKVGDNDIVKRSVVCSNERLEGLNLLLGSYQTTTGVKGRYWNGTIHSMKVWNSVLTDEELEVLF